MRQRAEASTLKRSDRRERSEACETQRVSLLCERSSEITRRLGRFEALCCSGAVSPKLKE
jgi:hypothetical protein